MPTIRLIRLLAWFFIITCLASPGEAVRDRVGTCIRNCAQCKRMFDTYFEGQLCAESCIKFKGKNIPDCEDINTFVEFVRRPDEPAEEDYK